MSYINLTKRKFEKLYREGKVESAHVEGLMILFVLKSGEHGTLKKSGGIPRMWPSVESAESYLRMRSVEQEFYAA
jgi:5-enolpyruvylshikimate-3-phosphate synthase